MRFSLSAAQGLNSEQSEQGVIRSASQFMRPLTFSETVENLIRVNSWNSWGFLLATNSTNFTKAIGSAFWHRCVNFPRLHNPVDPVNCARIRTNDITVGIRYHVIFADARISDCNSGDPGACGLRSRRTRQKCSLGRGSWNGRSRDRGQGIYQERPAEVFRQPVERFSRS